MTVYSCYNVMTKTNLFFTTLTITVNENMYNQHWVVTVTVLRDRLHHYLNIEKHGLVCFVVLLLFPNALSRTLNLHCQEYCECVLMPGMLIIITNYIYACVTAINPAL